MNELPESILIEALDLLEQGVGVEEIVARYPAQAAELRPLLLTAARLATLSTQPAVTAERRSRAAFLAAAAGQAAPRRAGGFGWLARLLAPALAVLLVVFLGGAALAGASGSATPGSALFEVKQFVEGARLALARDPERAAALRERFRQERIAEIEQLLARGAVADVALAGTIEAIDGERWMVAGLPVNVTADAVVDGSPVVGAWVEISGPTAVDAVRARRVTVVSAPPPAPAPAPPSAPSPSPTATALPASATPSASATPRSLEMPTRLPTPTAPPPPTATPSVNDPTLPPPPATATPDDNDDDDAPPPPTATPEADDPTPPPPPPTATREDDDNDNAGDNENDNGGDDPDDNDNGGGNDDNHNDNGGGNDDNHNDNGSGNDDNDNNDNNNRGDG